MNTEEDIGLAMSSQRGFTLIELAVVVVILGILAAVAMANYSRMRTNAERAACISNQRNVFEAGYAYAIDVSVPDGPMNVSVLQAAGCVPQDMCECPSSQVADFDDYTITWIGGLPTDVACGVKGGDHDWGL